VLDTTGGITATASTVAKMNGNSLDEIQSRIHQIGNIDLRVYYLRPGKGSRFLSTGTVIRTGGKVSLTRMELRNQDGLLIAVGTGTYIVG